MTSNLITSQQEWKNAIGKPNGSGALSPFMPFATSKTFISPKAHSTQTGSSSLIDWKGRPSKSRHQYPLYLSKKYLPYPPVVHSYLTTFSSVNNRIFRVSLVLFTWVIQPLTILRYKQDEFDNSTNGHINTKNHNPEM